jgi:hypothetical protein
LISLANIGFPRKTLFTYLISNNSVHGKVVPVLNDFSCMPEGILVNGGITPPFMASAFDGSG